MNLDHLPLPVLVMAFILLLCLAAMWGYDSGKEAERNQAVLQFQRTGRCPTCHR